LSGLSERKVLPLARDGRGTGFAAIYGAAGLPPKLLPAFRAALAARRECGPALAGSARLSREMIERVLTACEGENPAELGSLLALLRRYDVEAAREEARVVADNLFAPQSASAVVVAFGQTGSGAAPRIIQIDLQAIEAELAA
jgi:hypothetical protein